jgi:hypothetical protein
MFLGSQRRPAKWERSSLRCLVALLGILILTVSLAGRTFDLKVHNQTSVVSQPQKAKIQHRDKSGSQWAPALDRLEPFYVAVCSDEVEPEQEPLLSPHVDDCLYNRPPPLA